MLIVFLRLTFIKAVGLIETKEFTAKENKIAKYARALGHPARIAILNIIIKNQSCICGEIVEELPFSQSTVSQHLKELKEAGLIKGDIEGTKVCYCIDEKEWIMAKNVLSQLFDSLEQGKTCC